MMGCDRHCTYCIVRLRRGPARSRPVDEIVAEAEELVRAGAREIVLLGQNIDVYGRDLPGSPRLAGLLRRVHAIPGLTRLRFLTSHPADLEDEVIEAVAELPKVCPHWELPVQAGDDQVLRRMARGHRAADYLALAERIRGRLPGFSLATDVIVGFPGETEAQFERTLDLLRAVRFDAVHVAAYSVRPGTPAARLADDVPPDEKERRRRAVEALQEEVVGEINARLLGQEVEVLVEDMHKGKWRGRTATNKLVFFEHDGDWRGHLVTVRITKAGPWSLQGELE
jgi:tRNA-2-methylthio-N6-dimethylallyladenosine synthase